MIDVDRLTKEYTLGARARGYTTLREAINGWLAAPLGRRPDGPPFRALDDLSFHVAEGEAVGLIGRNGAGKSTALKVLSRITEPTSGTVTVRGRVASLLEVGTGFHPELTGRENIFLNGSLLGMRRVEIARKFDEIAAFSEVEAFLDTPVKRYSSGMYVRLAFAVAAHLEPEILIVDEVLAVGDVAFQQKCLGKMQDIGRSGRTVLFVSHNMSAITRLCTRALLLRQGRLVHDGPVLDGVKQYLAEGARPRGLVWDVAAEPRRLDAYGELARVTVVELRPRSATPEFQVGEDLAVRITLRTTAAIAHVAVGLGLDDLYGSRIATFNSDESLVTLDGVPGGEYTVDLCVPRPALNPGQYALSCAILSGGRIIDFVQQAAAFDIAPIDAETGEHAEPTAGAGPLRLPCAWTVR